MESLPHFKYHPDPLATGMIQQKPTTCPVCERVRAYVYVGPFLAKEDVEGICPWCIHDGSAAAKYQGAFQDPASCEDAASEHWEELLFRTPTYHLRLKFGWRLSSVEIARKLHKSESSVSRLLARALDQLRQRYQMKERSSHQ